MVTRKGYPFSRRASNQEWGILSSTIIVLLCIVVYAGEGCRMNRFFSIVFDAESGFNGDEKVPYECYINVNSPTSDYNKAVKSLVYGHRNDSTFINNQNGSLFLSVYNIAVNMICKTFGRKVK